MNGFTKAYHVYRFINPHQQQICHVVASGLDEAYGQLPSIHEISHWDLENDRISHQIMNTHGRPDARSDAQAEALIEWLTKPVANAFADACERNHYNDFPGYAFIKIRR